MREHNHERLSILGKAQTARCSSWDTSGRNADASIIEAAETKVLADLQSPGAVTHVCMIQANHYREALLRITWDNAENPSILVPIGDFFCLGHGIVNSFQSLLFTASTEHNNQSNEGCALNCYARMPFAERAVIEVINESNESHRQYYYINYETFDKPLPGAAYFHAEFRRTNPFGGWGHEIQVNSAEANIANKERLAWDNNYIILQTKGRGHYIGYNLSVTNFQGTWWGEGDDMIWVDGYKWPPDLHGTGTEDCLNQAWGMQPNAFLRSGSSIYEHHTNGYQTSYVLHLENPIRFKQEIKVTIEHGHANHLSNEMSSVGYWYGDKPTAAISPPPVDRRLPVLRDKRGHWSFESHKQCPGKRIVPTAEMAKMKSQWARTHR